MRDSENPKALRQVSSASCAIFLGCHFYSETAQARSIDKVVIGLTRSAAKSVSSVLAMKVRSSLPGSIAVDNRLQKPAQSVVPSDLFALVS